MVGLMAARRGAPAGFRWRGHCHAPDQPPPSRGGARARVRSACGSAGPDRACMRSACGSAGPDRAARAH